MKLSDEVLRKHNRYRVVTPTGTKYKTRLEPPKLMPKNWEPYRIPKTRVRGTGATRRWKSKRFKCPTCGYSFTTIVYKTHKYAQCPVCSGIAYSLSR